MHQIDRAQRCKEIEARIKEIEHKLHAFMGTESWPPDDIVQLYDERKHIRRELETLLGVDPKAARRTEIRGRLQELATQAMAASDAEFGAIGRESMALWTELDALNAAESGLDQPCPGKPKEQP